LLAEEFLDRFKKSSNKNIVRINSEALQMLEAYDWPGNVRELKNVIQRAVLVCEADEILPDHLPSRFRSAHTGRPSVTFEIGTSLAEVEREMIIRALMIADNNRKRAAELLGISRRAIYNKLQKHNID
ncbi:MAG: sigma-54-dependent Fis family transcriptional regulator, partial [Aliifodinibius sp.]|nr:sigma-54-dependent Fis family transcriptional regulator [Fodinibius sp.]